MRETTKPWYEGAMLTAIITTLLGLALPVSDAEADALRSTAPDYLTLERAHDHVLAARVAALVTGTDEHLLSSVAWHESRYDHRISNNREPGNKISCGVTTPVPMHRAQADGACKLVTESLLASYLAGGQHIAGWVAATGNLRTALLGVAGGYVGIRFCSDPKNAKTDYRCWTPEVFLERAKRIRHAMSRAKLETS